MAVTEFTRFTALPNACRERTTRPLDYHLERTGTEGYFVYCDACVRRKRDAQTAKSRAVKTLFVPDDMPMGWVGVENDVPQPRRDDSYCE